MTLLSRDGRRLATIAGALVAYALLVAGCASGEPVKERLDPDTAVTLTLIDRPLELLADTPDRAGGNPYIYMAPFEIDRMGARAVFLWMAVPEALLPLRDPRLLCNGRSIDLESAEATAIGVVPARPPYSIPSPLSAPAYLHLSEEELRCLAGAGTLALDVSTRNGVRERFTAANRRQAALEAFTRRY